MSASLRMLAEAVSVLSERRERDGLAQLLFGDPGPLAHQTALWSSKKSEAWLFGANRSGKTEAVAGCAASFLRFGNPDPRPSYCGGGIVVYDRAVRVWAISLNYDMSRNILQPRIFNNGAGLANGRFPFVPESELLRGTLGWNVTNQTLRLKNGSICIFKSCDAGRDAFQGADIDLAIFDEVPDEEVYREVSIRVGGGRRLLIRGAATILPPPGLPGGVSWMYEAKVRNWLDLGGTNEERNAKNTNLDIFTARLRDNPTILPEEFDRICAQFAPGSPEYMIRVEGALLPSIGGSLVYSNFRQSYHVNPALGPHAIDPYLPLCLSADFNPEAGVWIVGQKHGRVFRVLDEITMERSDIASMTYDFRSRYPAHQAELWIYGDATGRRRHEQTGQSNFHLIQNYLAGYPAPIRFIIPDVNPPVSDRIAAVQLILRPPDGTKRFEIASRCEVTINDLATTKWKAFGKIEKRGRMQSNGADCVGYWISTDTPTKSFGQAPSSLKSVRGPSYVPRPGVFPATYSNRLLHIRGKYYTRVGVTN